MMHFFPSATQYEVFSMNAYKERVQRAITQKKIQKEVNNDLETTAEL